MTHPPRIYPSGTQAYRVYRNEISTDKVLARSLSMEAVIAYIIKEYMPKSEIGSYVFATSNSSKSLGVNSRVKGSSLKASNADGVTYVSNTLAGTYVCRGYASSGNSSFSAKRATTLWQRIK